ncbi:MAG: response regulator, partial [Bacteroidota bacterium]
NWVLVATCLIVKGNIAFNKNDYSNALVEYRKVDSIHTVHDSITSNLPMALENIGLIHTELKSNEAITYFDRSIAAHEKMGNQAGVNNSIRLKGTFYNENGNPEESIKYLLQTLPFYKKFNEPNKLVEVYAKLVLNYTDLEEFEEAEPYLKTGLELTNQKGFSIFGINAMQISAASFYLKKKEFPRAIDFLKKAQTSSPNKGTLYYLGERNQIQKGLAEAYEGIGDYKNALQSKKQQFILTDSINLQNRAEITKELETKYQTEQKEQEIALLQAKNETVEAQKTNQRNLLLGGIGITTFAGVFLFFLFRNRQKTNKMLRELDTAKSNFFANISHELRTPLALIATPIQEKLQKKNLSVKDRKEYDLILRNNNRLIDLVDQLLDLSKLESGNLKLKVTETPTRNFLEAQLEPYRYLATSKDLDFEISMDIKEETLWIDREAFQKIVSNLFSNAIKHSAANGTVNGHLMATPQELALVVKNRAAPFTKLQKEQLFNRFYQTDEFKEGAGIGLALVKELVQLHKGKIEVKDGGGFVTFKVVLPCHKSDFNPDELYEGTDLVSTPQESVMPLGNTIAEDEGPIATDSGLPLLLIVEDNPDFRAVLQETLKRDYRIVVAVNGEEGVQLAIEQVPDLIISDVMMPRKNGVELTEELKAHELTSHIPIILLTAKAGDENELVGIDSGADDYITKPFNNTLLRSKMTNLLGNRQKMRDRYSQEVILKPQDIAVTPSDELLLERIQSVLDTYLMESSFSTEDFAKEMGFSRMQLHRKLKALTGLSATEFMRSQRLKLAAQLLEKSEANVSEVCYQTGFNNLSYFAKCFKEAYGVSPSQYPKKD